MSKMRAKQIENENFWTNLRKSLDVQIPRTQPLVQ